MGFDPLHAGAARPCVDLPWRPLDAPHLRVTGPMTQEQKALDFIRRSKSPPDIKSIAAHLQTTMAATYAHLGNLRKKGLIESIKKNGKTVIVPCSAPPKVAPSVNGLEAELDALAKVVKTNGAQIENLELKRSTLRRLGDIVDGSIRKVLLEISEDLVKASEP